MSTITWSNSKQANKGWKQTCLGFHRVQILIKEFRYYPLFLFLHFGLRLGVWFLCIDFSKTC